MRFTPPPYIRSHKALLFTSVVVVAIALTIATFAYSNRASAQDVPDDESIPLSHITPVVWEGRGSGDTLTSSFDLSAGVVVVSVNYDGTSSGSFRVRLVKTDGSDSHSVVSQYVRAGNSHSGAYIFDVHSRYATLSPGTYRIEVNSEGSWHIDVSQPRRPVGLELPRFVQGFGDNGYFPFAFHTGLVPIYYEYSGAADGSASIFGITLYKMDGSEYERVFYDFLTSSEVPKSGIESVTVHSSYTGDITPGVYALHVESEGNWRIALGAESYSVTPPTPTPQPTPTAIPVPGPTTTPIPTVTPMPTATPVPANDDVLNRLSALETLIASLQALVTSLESRVASLETSSPPTTPIPTPQPTATPTPVVGTPTPAPDASPTPAPIAGCVQAVDDGSVDGSWSSDCVSENSPDGNTYYARFYTFSLSSQADVAITLTSSVDTYLLLMSGEGTSGNIVQENGGGTTSRIQTTLQQGSYTIEASTNNPETSGDFTLTLDITP